MYRKVKGFKRAVYVDLNQDRTRAENGRCAHNSQRILDHDVDVIYKSMKGLGTDEANLIRVLANKTNAQIIELNKRFNVRFGEKGDLLKWIADDTSGDLRMVLEAMAKDEAIADADAMKKAMKGLDTDEKELVDILAERSLCEIERMKLAYKRRNPEREDLSVWLTKKTDGEFRQLLLALLDRSAFIARHINEALTGPNKDERELVRIFLNFRRHEHVSDILEEFNDPLGLAIDLTTDLEQELVMPAIADVKRKYLWLYDEPLEAAIAKSTSGVFGFFLQSIIEEPAERDATYFREMVTDTVKNGPKIMELLVTRSPRERTAIDTVYYNRYGKTMADELFKPKEASTVNPNDPGIVRAAERAADFVRKSVHKIEEVLDINNVADFEKTLLRLSRPRADALAYALHENKRRWFQIKRHTDTHIITLLTHRSKKEIREAALAYEEIFGMPLIKDIRHETHGWYEKTMCYIIREAFEERVHVPYVHVHVVRDIDRS